MTTSSEFQLVMIPWEDDKVLVMSCRIVSCRVMSCPALSCLAVLNVSCLVLVNEKEVEKLTGASVSMLPVASRPLLWSCFDLSLSLSLYFGLCLFRFALGLCLFRFALGL